MTAKHTPLPWKHGRKNRIESPTIGGGSILVVGEGDIMGRSWPEAVANTDLIVRAVNCHAALLEALEELVQYAASEIDVPLTECVSGPIGKARAAIALATKEN